MNVELKEMDMTYGAQESNASEVIFHLAGGGIPRIVCFPANTLS
jgi:hypothetical protein